MIPKIVTTQRDFSGGEINSDGRRSEDTALFKASARQMSNWRILNSRKPQQRPGRRARYPGGGRADPVRMSSGHEFDLNFTGDGVLSVRDASGALLFAQAGLPWTAGTLKYITWTTYLNSIYITHPSMQPRVLSWDGVSTWSLAVYSEQINAAGQKRTPFYRISPRGITLKPSGTSGSILLDASSAIFTTNAWLNTRLRYINKQMTITAIASPTQAVAMVNETLPPGQAIHLVSDPTSIVKVGELVAGSKSSARGQVVLVDGPGKTVLVQLFTSTVNVDVSATGSGGDLGMASGGTTIITAGFVAGENLITGAGTIAIDATSSAPPQAVALWDEEVINNFRGWPGSVSVDQGRLTFCDLPSIPNGIIWSAEGAPDDIHIGALPKEGFFELAPKKCRVYHVVGTGNAAGDQLVLSDTEVWFIPISQSNPLKPGSVTFLSITNEPSSQVRPAVTPEAVLYVNAGLKRIIAIIGTGQQTRPYMAKDVSSQHEHLFKSPIALAVSNGEGTFPERYAYVLNADGSMAVGRYEISNDFIGWVPWTSNGIPGWISVLGATILITNDYGVIETLEDAIFLDGAVLVNNVPVGMTPPLGKGPHWWLPNGTVLDLMDSDMPLGTRAIDNKGFLTPNEGDDLSSPTLLAGFRYEPVLEPFVPEQEPGQSVKQRMRPRRIARIAVAAQEHTGYLIEGLNVQAFKRIAAYRVTDNPNIVPPRREDVQLTRPLGRQYDPRWQLRKDSPGPIRISEITQEVTV